MGERRYLSEEELGHARQGGPDLPGMGEAESAVQPQPEERLEQTSVFRQPETVPERTAAIEPPAVADAAAADPLTGMSGGCRRHLEAALPARLDSLTTQQRLAAGSALCGGARYAVDSFLAKGAECNIYNARVQGYVFCVKAVRNWLDRWIGRSGMRGEQGRLAGVSYKTKVRHITNEYNVGSVLCSGSRASAGAVRFFSLRRVRRFGLEIGWDLLMERINGIDLGDKALLRSMSIEDKLRVALQMCRLIGVMHRRHLVHLDIKPSNFMLERDGRVRLIDFGISVTSGYRSRTVAGTAGFFSPEQICCGTLREDTDIFALGVAIAIIFGGKALSQNADEVLQKTARKQAASALESGTVPALGEIPELAQYREIAGVIRSCTVFKRSMRINSCQQLAARLRNAAEKSGLKL